MTNRQVLSSGKLSQRLAAKGRECLFSSAAEFCVASIKRQSSASQVSANGRVLRRRQPSAAEVCVADSSHGAETRRDQGLDHHSGIPPSGFEPTNAGMLDNAGMPAEHPHIEQTVFPEG